MKNYRKGDEPLFNGGKAFGDFQSFTCTALTNTPASIDTFLGNAPGTTQYAASGGCFGLTGRFYGTSPAAVQRQIDAISSLAGISAAFGYPTLYRLPDDFKWAPRSCYFVPAEFVPTGISPYPGGNYSATYKLVMRVTTP